MTAGIEIKRQPSEQEELPGPLPDQTEGQPLKTEDNVAKMAPTSVKAEAEVSDPDDKAPAPFVKDENGENIKLETDLAPEAKTSTASQLEELSLRPWASPSTPPSKLILLEAAPLLKENFQERISNQSTRQIS